MITFPTLAIAEPNTDQIVKNIYSSSFEIKQDKPAEFPHGEYKQFNIYEDAGIDFNVDPAILMAVHDEETGKSGNTCINSYAGAVGPMQFLPSTFVAYAVDGDNDGSESICNLSDAIHTASHYLAANGANRGQVRQALWQYNHADWYVEEVLYKARTKYGYKG
ncbi:MAG: lytic transglycosylase domain-containing protein [Bacteroidota bacterium]|nr:lytic transglycosylase domain-containing protein [Bacteroidota bacterium]